ncbi:MAG: peptidoglycan DD-metalloendopeptidase family protein [Candidatus Thiodiazotropha sp. (ex Notomyrtea botanica)]|nr:peptidoglycan DD-metalloendopeptidase family protein [Candidatus Thiodiazotropha sp. (ex Notomyrtea botanica)]
MEDLKSYKFHRQTPRRQLVKRLVLAGIFLVLLALVFLYLITPGNDESNTSTLPEPTTTPKTQAPDKLILPLNLPGQSSEGRHTEPENIPLPASGFISTAQADETTAQPVQIDPAPVENTPVIQPKRVESHWLAHEIKSGESLSSIFKKHGLSANLLHRIVHSSDTAKQLTDIRPGETLHLELDDTEQFLGLRLEHSKIRSLQITPDEESFSAIELTREVEKRTSHTSGVIESSLYLTAQEVGLSENLIMELANIFGWDIDFALEIRAGDRFTVIYQEDYLDGEKLRDGPILAAEFINRGRSYRALRYEDETGRADYFTPEGRSMRKAFLRAPVDFRRISSRFTQERWHPVLGKKRPHRGVDYAAKTGTPIKAAGDGKIIHRGTKGGYGRTVIIQHGQRYTTLYAHLSRYNKKAKSGTKVKQGQVIGYVGSSGLATGPHLHYEFRVNGAFRNPLTIKLPAAKPIAKKYRDDFQIKIQPLISRLETISSTLVADAQ